MDLSGTSAAAQAPEPENAQPTASELPSPLRAPFLTVDGFLDPSAAQAMRGHFEGHFANPHGHSPDVHQVWNYWHVPDLYTYLRTSPEKVIPEALVEAFHAELTAWAEERLGMGCVTWPNLSLYVDGCCQNLHNDSTNGRFGFVYSLTPDTRRSRGGETLLLREGDLFRSNLQRAAAGSAMRALVEPKFNRLTVFDDRIPHGVERVEGTMDPLDGRLVLHGHISECGPIVKGPLSATALSVAVEPLVDAAMAEGGGAGGNSCHGPLTLRIAVGADGGVEHAAILVDRVVRSDGGDPGPVVDAFLAGLRTLRLPAQEGASEVTMPVMFGGPLPWMVRKEGLVAAKVEPKPLVARESVVARGAVVAGGTVVARPVAKVAPVAKAAPAVPHRRAEIGAQVRERLLSMNGVAKIPKDTLEAFVVPHFLTPAQCDGLMRLIDSDLVPSGLLSPNPDPEFRTSESCNLSPREQLVASFEWRVNELMGIEPALAETAQGQRYAVGQQFKPHHDFFHTDQPYWPEQEAMGGQRTWTAMAFLNKPEAGGQTMFPKAGLRITPAPGHLLIWNNMDAAGEPNPYSLHQGMPVEAGVKYVITKWYRERKWGKPDAAPAG